MRVLVLGAYGLIGREIVRRLGREQMSVAGLGRDAAEARRARLDIDWLVCDLANMTEPDAWAEALSGVDAVVNASGALQDGARDHLDATQHQAICALISACETVGVRRFIQISAPGARPGSPIAFLRTKGLADDFLRASALGWVIFKPGLVIAATAYGGTSLLRQLAAAPVVQPLLFADSEVQTVAASDVAEAVAIALLTDELQNAEYDLVEDDAHSLRTLVAEFRAWLGFAPARLVIEAPTWLGFAIASLADLAGRLGWRSPLRSTSLRVMKNGVVGDPTAWKRATHGATPIKSLRETLSALPSTAQERVFARTQFIFPVALATLALFWLASGLIGVARSADAAQLLVDTPLASFARVVVIAGGITDMLIGSGLMMRRWMRAAAWAGAAVSISYLVLGTAFAPQLWLDPLGPFVKIFPVLALTIVVLALRGER